MSSIHEDTEVSQRHKGSNIT